MDGVYEVMSYLVGHSLTTLELVAYADVARRSLIEQLPFLESLKYPPGEPGKPRTQVWVAEKVKVHGEEHSIVPIEEMGAQE